MADNFLTRKVGPLPVWGYGILGFGILYLYRRQKAASTAAAGTTTSPSSATYNATVPDIPTASVTEPGGFSYTGPLGGLQTLMPTGAMSATSGSSSGNGVSSFLPLTGQQMYAIAQNNPQSQSIFYQSAPGIFTNISPTAFTPTSPQGMGYELAPPGYTPPSGVTPVTGVIAA